MTDDYHVAYPKLYGAPAYARPPRPALPDARPFDPDELPLEAHRVAEEEHDGAGLELSAALDQGVAAPPVKTDLVSAARRALGLDR